jgi:hypothetical protein
MLKLDYAIAIGYNQYCYYLWGDYVVVEKVKPDPLNLLVNTNVGKQITYAICI